MAEAKLYGQNKGGMSINGIIKDYYAYAGENVSAGDLVEYVNGIASKTDYGESVDTQLSALSNSAANSISAVALDDSRVFITHGGIDGVNKLGAMVCTIEGATITCGTDTTLSNAAGSGRKMSVAKLNENKVFIAYSGSASVSDRLNGIVCTIDRTTISAGESLELGPNYSSNSVSAVALDDSRVFIAYCYNSKYYIDAKICSIDGTTITLGTTTELSQSYYTGSVISACLLSNGNVFIAHSIGSNYYLYGIVCSISGTTITAGNDTEISIITNSGYVISAVALDENRIFIAHSRHTDCYLYGIVVGVNGTTITLGSDTAIEVNYYEGKVISVCLLPDGNVFIAHSKESNYSLFGIVVNIDGTTITCGTDAQINIETNAGYAISSLLLNNGTIFIAHSNGASCYLHAQIFGIDYENNLPTNHIIATEYETQVRKVTTGQFDGIAKTSGTGGDDTGHKDIVSIWTLE